MPMPIATRKILIVSNNYPPHSVGGAEVVAHRQALMLRAAGWNVRVFAGDLSAHSYGRPISTSNDTFEGIDVVRVAGMSPVEAADFIDAVKSSIFDETVRVFQPDIIHFHNVIGLPVDLIPRAKSSGALTIATLHDYWGICLKNTLLRNDLAVCANFDECHLCQPTLWFADSNLPIRLRRDFVAHCLLQADAFVSPSRALAEIYAKSGMPQTKLHVISNGIDLNAIRPRLRRPHECVEFLCLAYLGEHKGVLILLKALQKLWADESLRGRWRIRICGGGHLADSLRGFIEEAELNEAVMLMGRVRRDEGIQILDESDVVIMPSIWPENQPVSLLEGVASGAALIATRLGGNPELVEHDVNGLLCDPASMDALAGAMHSLIVSPSKINKFSSENLRRRPGFDETECGRQLEELYARADMSLSSKELVVLCGPASAPEFVQHRIENAPILECEVRVRLLFWKWARDRNLFHPHAAWLWGTGRDLWAMVRAMRGLQIRWSQRSVSRVLRRLAKTQLVENEIWR